MRSGQLNGIEDAEERSPQTGRIDMAGTFEVFVDGEALFRFRLKAPDGTVVAESAAFSDKPAAVAGIAAVRECAGMGLVTDLCPEGGTRSGILPAESAARPCGGTRPRPTWLQRGDDIHARAGSTRRATAAPKWIGAA